MDAVVGLAAVGVASSGAAGYLVARLATVRHERLRRTWALAAEGGRGVAHPGLAWRLRHGVSGLRPVAEALLRREPVRRYVLWARMALEQRGYASTSDALLSLVLGACLALLVAGWVVAASPVFGAAVAGCALVALCAAVKNDAERREAALRDEIPDALRSLGVCFRAGLSLMQTLEQTASEMKGPLGELFLSAALVLQTGGTASEALALFRQRADVPELAFVAVALDVQHRSGGSLAAVLDAARESVESEIDLARSLKVQTAQAQLSARIVTAMPFVLIALFSLMSPGFLSPFFESMAGMALLAAALVMQVAGVVLVHRMLDAGGMDASWVQGAAAIVAVGSAALLGGMASRIVGAWRRRIRHRAAVVEGSSALQAGRAPAVGEEGVDARIVAYAVELSQRARSPLFRFLSPSSLRERPLPDRRLAAAGLGGALSPAGYGEARVRLMLGGAVLGGAVGLTATTELAALLAVIGAVAGWRALPWAVKRRSCRRAEAMECDLSEMLDVVALGMRSGMSFDRSLDLYTGYFRTQLADAFRSAQRQWACGLASRPEALREVADSYASPLLARVIENIVRSLRFGATMADNLEDAAREARSGYKARRQEAVAKAPVKMMVPTGVLILPAMLMLVLGPVLLELAGGF